MKLQVITTIFAFALALGLILSLSTGTPSVFGSRFSLVSRAR